MTNVAHSLRRDPDERSNIRLGVRRRFLDAGERGKADVWPRLADADGLLEVCASAQRTLVVDAIMSAMRWPIRPPL